MWELHALLLKIEGSHLRCKTANKFLKVHQVAKLERNKCGPLASTFFLRSVSVCERNPDLKKKM